MVEVILEGIPGGIPSAQLPDGCISVLATMIPNATTVALGFQQDGDSLDIMRSISDSQPIYPTHTCQEIERVRRWYFRVIPGGEKHGDAREPG
jgi:hypothetical protein